MVGAALRRDVAGHQSFSHSQTALVQFLCPFHVPDAVRVEYELELIPEHPVHGRPDHRCLCSFEFSVDRARNRWAKEKNSRMGRSTIGSGAAQFCLHRPLRRLHPPFSGIARPRSQKALQRLEMLGKAAPSGGTAQSGSTVRQVRRGGSVLLRPGFLTHLRFQAVERAKSHDDFLMSSLSKSRLPSPSMRFCVVTIVPFAPVWPPGGTKNDERKDGQEFCRLMEHIHARDHFRRYFKGLRRCFGGA